MDGQNEIIVALLGALTIDSNNSSIIALLLTDKGRSL